MGAPSTDQSAVKQIIKALANDGWEPYAVNDGEETVSLRRESKPAKAAVKQVMGTTDAVLVYVEREGERGTVLFVLGNEPFEVAADYSPNLNDTIEPLTDGWL